MALVNTYNDQAWLISLHRALDEWLRTKINNYVKQGATPAGLEIYDLTFEFPSADKVAQLLPFDKTLIHLQLDDIENRRLGLGENVVKSTVNPSAPTVAGLVIDEEAKCHVLNYDVGVWTSDKAGGVTARLEAEQMLSYLLDGPFAQRQFQEDTRGIEIMGFNGGRFIQEEVGGTTIFRTVDTELILRCYSRKVIDPSTLVDEIDTEGGILISDEIIVDVPQT